MSTVRQMAEIYLRGSLSNVTMKNLTPDQVRFSEKIANEIADHPEMRKHRYKVRRMLGETIKADYSSDSDAADQEYKIAIWRGVVNLFYHRHYKFKCHACGATHKYVKATGQMKPLDQAQTPCPNCQQIEVNDPGESQYQKGQYVNLKEFEESCQDYQVGIPTYVSTIKAFPGGGFDKENLDQLLLEGKITQAVYERRLEQYRYDEPFAIIEDKTQLAKFFGEFVWGYFKQQLRENKRPEHNKKPVEICGRADEVIVQEILSIAARTKVPALFCSSTQPEHGWWNIGIVGLQTPPEFTGELMPVLAKAVENDVRIAITPTMIKVEHNINARNIQALITKPEHVIVLDNNQSVSDEEDGNKFSIDQVDFKTVEGCKMELIESTELLERHDIMMAVENSLPEGDCRKIYQIIKQDGEIYQEFRKVYDYDSEPRQAHIAKFLNITPRCVKNHLAHIRLACLSHNFVPSVLNT